LTRAPSTCSRSPSAVDSFASSSVAEHGTLDRFKSTAIALRISALRDGRAKTIQRVRDDEAALLRTDAIMAVLGESREEQEANAAQLQAALDGAMTSASGCSPC